MCYKPNHEVRMHREIEESDEKLDDPAEQVKAEKHRKEIERLFAEMRANREAATHGS